MGVDEKNQFVYATRPVSMNIENCGSFFKGLLIQTPDI